MPCLQRNVKLAGWTSRLADDLQLQHVQGGQSAEEEDSNKRLAPNTPQGEQLVRMLACLKLLSGCCNRGPSEFGWHSQQYVCIGNDWCYRAS